MKAAHKGTTVFARVRASMRSGQTFSPTKVSTKTPDSVRVRREDLGTYASVEQFASCAGLPIAAVESMVAFNRLTHLRIEDDGPYIHVDKGLDELERREQGPGSQLAAAGF